MAALLCAILSQLLVVLDDTELYDDGRPLPLHQLRRLVKWLKELLFQAANTRDLKAAFAASGGGGSDEEVMGFFWRSGFTLLKNLYDRSSRKPFVASQAWLVPGAETGRVLAEVQGQTPRGLRILQCMPFALPFVERLKLFKQFVDTEKASTQASGAPAVKVPLFLRSPVTVLSCLLLLA